MSATDPQLLLLGATDAASLRRRLAELRERAFGAAAIGEIGSAEQPEGELRAAVVAGDTEELLGRLEILRGWLEDGIPDGLRTERGIALGQVQERPRIGFLFPGQGAPVPSGPGYLAGWLPDAAAIYEQAGALPAAPEEIPPELVQLAVVTASVAGLRALEALGIEAAFGLGHSVGELTALHWAGALDEEAVLRLARRRGEAMTEHATAEGSMANIETDEETFSRIVAGADVSVACVNSPRHRVVSGTTEAVDAVVARAHGEDGTRVVRLHVVGAFHSPLMRQVAPVFERDLSEESLGQLQRPVYSTITGGELGPDADLLDLLTHQMTQPVRFLEAASEAINDTQLLVEVGPGRMLSALVSEFSDTPAVPLRIGHSSPQGLLTAVGAAHAIGIAVRTDRLPDGSDPRPSA